MDILIYSLTVILGMAQLEIEQKSMLSTANDDGLFLRIQKENAKKINDLNLQGRRLDVKVIITY